MALTYSVMSNVQLQLYTTSGTTGATGAVSFTLPAGMFTVVYGAHATVVRDSADPTLAAFAVVRSFTASTVMVQVFESAGTVMKANAVAEGLAVTTTPTTVLLTVFGM